MRTSPRSCAWLLMLLLSAVLSPCVEATDGPLTRETYFMIGEALANRKVAEERDWALGPRTRGQTSLRDVFKRTVRSVPLIVSGSGLGSGALIGISETTGIVITNQHVVNTPLLTDKGQKLVAVFFFDPELAAEPFQPERMASCFDAKSPGEWCRAVKKAMRVAVVIAVDPGRDLALVIVPDLPKDVTALSQTRTNEAQPGDDVSVIGHPLGFLWTMTTGIVSAIRQRYPLGSTTGTIIQTQTPISPGNSGGPLLASSGALLGVIVWSVAENAQGLNAAIASDEVQAFAAEQLQKAKGR